MTLNFHTFGIKDAINARYSDVPKVDAAQLQRRATIHSTEALRLSKKHRTEQAIASHRACPHSKYLVCSACYNATHHSPRQQRRQNLHRRHTICLSNSPEWNDEELLYRPASPTPPFVRKRFEDSLDEIPESGEAEVQKNFVIDPKEGVIDCGDTSADDREEIAVPGMDDKRNTDRISILVIGADGTGKTTLINQFVESETDAEQNSFVPTEEDEASQNNVIVTIQGHPYDVTFTELHFTLENEYNWKQVIDVFDGFIILFSMPDRKSFDKAIEALEVLNQYAITTGRRKPTILVGNKSDLARKLSVHAKEAQTFAEQFQCKFVGVSTALNQNTELLLVGIVEAVRAQRAGAPPTEDPVLSPQDIVTEENEVEESTESHGPHKGASHIIADLGHALMRKLHLSTNA